MKKLFFTLFVITGFCIYLGEKGGLFTLTQSVRELGGCCSKTCDSKSDNTFNAQEYKRAEARRKVSSILPAYVWDTKMMIR
jgi:hypothetical protein